ncbi:hypothetical protein [uncultured Pseudoteredinibacter sp.]|uniref:hypothetical protein n=1 Tax=uncultured Pseudoteredinibacter sp. TaxID=1641701 RepID=UPI00261DFC8D|nr:hypothetical protein [uncultured Pseudoteredinibacter sp.]
MKFEGIIVFGSDRDHHINKVVENIVPLGINVVVVDPFEAKGNYSLEIDTNGKVKFSLDGMEVGENFIIWTRLKVVPETPLCYEVEERALNVCHQEWIAFYTTISAIFPNRTLNDRNAVYMSRHKGYQQCIAASCGLKSPASLLTTSKFSILDMLDRHGKTIVKSNASGYGIPPSPESDDKTSRISNGRHMSTMRLDRETVANTDDKAINSCPIFVQEEIRKDYELRITIVGSEIFAHKIDSQKEEYTKLDWRLGSFHLEIEPVDLPREVRENLFKYMRKSGMFSGAIDMIVDESGAYWFLECNPEGQWAWLDIEREWVIAKAFSRQLISRYQETQPIVRANFLKSVSYSS